MYDNEALHYQGSEPYLYIAGCEEDNKTVIPILEKLAKDHRIWFARENAYPKADSETIAQKILGSAGCIAFITQKAVRRHGFRREVCYALEKGKPFLAVFMEEVSLTLGLEMELSDVKSLSYPEYQGQEQLFFFHILMTDFVLASRIFYLPFKPPGSEPSAKASFPADINEPDTIPPEEARTIPPPLFSFGEKGPAALAKEDKIPGYDFPSIYLTPVKKPDGALLQSASAAAPLEIQDVSVPQAVGKAWLVRNRTGEEIPLPEEPFCLGRSYEDCGYVISDNSAVSKKHALIFCREGCFCAMDLGSFNHTYINDTALQPELSRRLQDGDAIRLANEGFVFHQIKEGDA